MRGRLSSKAVTPLLEVVVILFFFAFMSTMVLKLFVMSYQRSVLARDINMALWAAQDVAEGLRGGVGIRDFGLEQQYGMNPTYTLYYDADWNPMGIHGQDTLYELRIEISMTHPGAALEEGSISVYRVEQKDGTVTQTVMLANLPFAHHTPIGGAP